MSGAIDALGYAAAALTTSAFVPQAVRTIKSRDTRGISLWMYVIFTAGVALWLAYGIAAHSAPIAVANLVTLILSATVLVLKLRHG